MDSLGADLMEYNNHMGDDRLSVSTSETGTDGILSHENEELRDRVALLEKKVQQQEDEIVCLKSALSDCIRRITSLEAGRPAFQNSVLPSKPTFRTPQGTPRKTSTSNREPISRRTSNPSTTPSKVVPRHSISSSSPSMSRKWPSMPSTDTANGHISPSNVKEPTFNQEDGCLRIYLRGRAVNMYAPTDLTDYDVTTLGEAPSEKLKLEWVYGYRGRDARCNLYLLPTGEMVYFAAAVVVLYNVEEQMQRHYMGHTDDVKCLAIHPDKITIATGQVAGHDKKEGKRGKVSGDASDNLPHIRIWDSVSLNTLHVIGIGDFERAVACVAFSKADGGQHLVAVDDANEHIISLWDWQKSDKGHKITETKSSTEPILAAEFHPCDKNVIVTCGKGHLAFWTVEGGTLTKKMGIFEKHDKPKYVTCMAFNENGDLLTGDSNGSVFIWGRGTNRISNAMVGAHEGGIFSILVTKDGTLLTGGKDRRIVQWNSSYQSTGEEYELPEQYGAVRMLSQGRGNMVLVGTTRNSILHGTIDLKFTPIVQGHMDELWGMAVHPNQNQFVTCGYDRTLYLWDTLSHSAIWTMQMPDGCHSACYHPDGEVIIVGTVAARWLVIDTTSRDIISTHTDGNEQIECVQFSPDGNLLAIGSRDNYIYVYNVTDGGKKFSRVGRCSGHSSFVTHIDFSADGQFLQSNSGDYELLYWNTATCKQVTSASSLRDVEWATHYCTLGFNVCGIWPEGADGTDVNACCRSKAQAMVASADDFGKVNLYKYPCCQPKSTPQIYGGHSSHVTNVQFLHDDSRLLSAGGKDMAILQWEISA